ncbi:MAG: 4Fe-4S binding protein [Victivallales bacterium]|nr:4Fe-4S binding protein [Victivallales bacterium]
MGKPNKKFAINVNEIWCKGCNICVHFCPKNVLSMTKMGKVKIDKPDDCTGCKLCELRCPDLAITISECKKED